MELKARIDEWIADKEKAIASAKAQIKDLEFKIAVDSELLSKYKNLNNFLVEEVPREIVKVARKKRHERMPNGYIDDAIISFFSQRTTPAYIKEIHAYLKASGLNVTRQSLSNRLGRYVKDNILVRESTGKYSNQSKLAIVI
jgi:hypothetical protein